MDSLAIYKEVFLRSMLSKVLTKMMLPRVEADEFCKAITIVDGTVNLLLDSVSVCPVYLRQIYQAIKEKEGLLFASSHFLDNLICDSIEDPEKIGIIPPPNFPHRLAALVATVRS